MHSNELFARKLFVCELLIPLEIVCKISVAYFTGKHLYWSLSLKIVAVLNLELYQKRDSDTGVFPFEIFKSTFFTKRLRTTASVFQ